MGQAESADNDDQNCFRGCVKVKKEPFRKIEAKPQSRQNKLTHFQSKQLNQACQPIPNISEHITHKITTNPTQSCETSLQLRHVSQQAANRQKYLQENSTQIVTVDIREPPLLTAANDQANQIVLGLQSKMSSRRQINFKSADKIGKVKGSGMCEMGTPTTRCNSQQKQSGSQTETTTKTSRTTSTGKSRNILMNKIEQIKQKYYERQLQIEIYQDQRDYQQQIDQIDQIQRTFTQQSHHVPQNSIRQIKAIRQKILAKLREKKENKQKQNLGNHIVHQDNTLNLTIDKSLTIHDQLEIYSRQGRNSFDENLMQSQKIKNSKRLKKSQSASAKMELHGSINRSLNRSSHEVSLDEKVQFSQYSEQTLHQIRELDQQYQDYRSKMTNKSNFKNNLHPNPSQNQLSSHFSKRPPLSKFSRLNGRENDQKSPQPFPPSKLKKPSKFVCQQNQGREGSEASQVQSYKVRQQSGVTQFSKGNKILLF